MLKIPPTTYPLKIDQHNQLLNITCNLKKNHQTNKNYINSLLGDDQHKSEYSIPYLYSAINSQRKHKPIFWDKNALEKIITKPIAHEELFNDRTRGCKKLLKSILQLGVGMVDGVEATPLATEKLIDQVAPQMDSIFGKTSVISSDYMKHEDFAYTNVGLEAHNDNTYWNDAAG